jgi:hypothetical protein
LQLRIVAENGQSFLRNARDLDEQTRVRFRQKAEEARFLSTQILDTLIQARLLGLNW